MLELIRSVDLDENGMIDFEEFLDLITTERYVVLMPLYIVQRAAPRAPQPQCCWPPPHCHDTTSLCSSGTSQAAGARAPRYLGLTLVVADRAQARAHVPPAADPEATGRHHGGHARQAAATARNTRRQAQFPCHQCRSQNSQSPTNGEATRSEVTSLLHASRGPVAAGHDTALASRWADPDGQAVTGGRRWHAKNTTRNTTVGKRGYAKEDAHCCAGGGQ